MMKLFKKSPAQTALGFLLVLFIGSIVLIQQYISTERQRDLVNWQSRLGIIADMHKLSIEKLIKQQKRQLTTLSQTPTLQLYLSQFGTSTLNSSDLMTAQASYVRSLLHAASQRMGLNTSTNVVPRINSFGLAVVNKKGKLLFASQQFSLAVKPYKQQLQNALISGEMQLIDLQLNEQQNAIYGFIIPIFPIQQLQSNSNIGALLLILDPYQGLFKELSNPHLSTQSDETLLVSQQQQLIYLSPLQAPAQIFHRMSAETKSLAANFAIQQPSQLAIKQDYRGRDALVTGRKISQTPWTLVQKIDANEALKESDEHQRFLISIFSLLSLFLSMLLIAVWRHSTSLRLQKISNKLEARTTLLNAVSDNINDHIFLLDSEQHFVFANQSLQQQINLPQHEIIGKHVTSILGTDTVKQLSKCPQLKSTEEDCILQLPLGDQQGSYHASQIQLDHGAYKNNNLYVLHDISHIQQIQNKRDRLAQGIISTLVKAVDLHDPFCANHSERTREVALKIAQALNLDKARCQSLEMAALLANIGKLFIDKSILTKMDSLSDDENQQLRKHIDFAVDILKQLEFEGPVVEIIAQKNERIDGHGYPNGLKGEALLLESKILSVANAFVAMSSSRAYRQGREINQVLELLLEQADTQFDRHIIAALFHIAENQSNWSDWQSIESR